MKQISIFFFIFLFTFSNVLGNEKSDFLQWKNQFKILAIKNNISEKTFDTVMSNVKFLPKVIQYDRYQPEFYEDTKTYISKRTSKKKVSKGLSFFAETFKYFFGMFSFKFIL